jgi:thiol-disulfide isomerase/thioredoxin
VFGELPIVFTSLYTPFHTAYPVVLRKNPWTSSDFSPKRERGWTMKILNRYFFIGLAAGLILTILIISGGGYILLRSFTSRSGEKLESILQPPPFPVEAKMDYNWRLQGLDGKALDVRKTKGKVIFLNFWATWCPPCVAEMPSIQRLYEVMRSEGIEGQHIRERKGIHFPNLYLCR